MKIEAAKRLNERLKASNAMSGFKTGPMPDEKELIALAKDLKVHIDKPTMDRNKVVARLDQDEDMEALVAKMTAHFKTDPKSGGYGKSKSWTWQTAQNERISISQLAHPLDKKAPLLKTINISRVLDLSKWR